MGNINVADIASRKSILIPDMQGYASTPCHSPLSNGADYNSITYSEDGEQPISNVIACLALRRDLSHPENPPFGAWWTYTVEETLLWPVLDYQGPINQTLDALFDSTDEEMSDDEDFPPARRPSSQRKKSRLKNSGTNSTFGLDDGDLVPQLINSFLRNVHVRSPILDPPRLRNSAKNLVENGLDWDGETCQVLLACALGAISSPWDTSVMASFDDKPPSSPDRSPLAQKYFQAATKRLGALWANYSLISAQCFFLTGLFHMFMQEPVAGWRAFNSASITCRAYASKRIAQMARRSQEGKSQINRSMEQRLFWSSFKAEREIGCEFGLDTAGINRIVDWPTLPTPPSGHTPNMQSTPNFGTDGSESTNENNIPSSHLYEEQSWYFYLLEITLCKLEMRIDNFFQDKRREAYRQIGSPPEVFFTSLVVALQEFNYQLTSYYESLPPVMQIPTVNIHEDNNKEETNQKRDESNKNKQRNTHGNNNINQIYHTPMTPCSDELREYLRLRILSVRHDICLPALYLLLHNDVSGWQPSLLAVLVQLTNTCLKVDMNFLHTIVTTHRHHAAWICLRKGVRAALILIAARRLAEQGISRIGRTVRA
ncbi:uncharacterized protein N7483_012884 [Penicillium malachiteum]|uniref:uncharacterized protein n=1 Tax=Penicillium malachiteum TaxID=1324776 RepID=UPI0025497CAB|nr:uncharacterized protein N7483_012884 [Penicillium malachiteum]KAJ5715703.1 hypothetical protein N7483_012884 [Penicillium malachiteum]